MAKRNFKSPRYAASAPASSQLVAFNEIESGVNKGKLLFRLIHSWEARNPSKGGLLIGLELLLIDEKANLYEFYNFNRESGGEIYFTMPRLQNDSPASLLARVMGIIGSIDHEMLTKGRDSHKYFTKNRMLYERNQESNRLEYLIPKRTSLRHRLPMGDQGFTDFVAHLLEINPKKRPSASEALKHPWLSYPYEPISA